MQEIAQINTHFCVIFAAPLVQTGFRIQIDVIMTSTTLEGRGCDFGGFAGYNTLNDFWPLLLFLHNHSSMLFLHFLFLCYFFVSFHFSERLLFHPWFSRHLSSIDQWYFHDYFSNPTFEIFLPIDYSLYCVLDNILLIFHSTSHFHRTCIDAFMISFLFPFFYAFSTPFFHHFFSFSFVFHFFSFSFLSFPYQFLINSLSIPYHPYQFPLWLYGHSLSYRGQVPQNEWFHESVQTKKILQDMFHLSLFFCLVSISRLFWLFCCLFMVFPYCSSFGERVCVMVQRNLKNLQKNDSPQPHKLVPPCDFTTIHLSIPWSFCIPCSNI